jgi:hypothetical protein
VGLVLGDLGLQLTSLRGQVVDCLSGPAEGGQTHDRDRDGGQDRDGQGSRAETHTVEDLLGSRLSW